MSSDKSRSNGVGGPAITQASGDRVVSFADARRPHEFARKEKRLEETRQAFETYLEAGEGLSRQQKRKKERDKNKKGRPNRHP